MDHILMATLGVEPQVVTLALDHLLQQGYPINRVIVLHTDATASPVRESLAQLEHEFYDTTYYPRRITFAPELLTDVNGPLQDVATAHEVDAAFEALYSIIRRLKLTGARLHLSLAGGRKTMAIFAFAVAQLLFEEDDYIWHLVSSEDLRRSRAMHTHNPANINLVEVPFLRWSAPPGLRRQQQRHADGLSAQPPSHNAHRMVRFLKQLSHSERELVEMLVKTGYTNAELASALHKSQSTVANQLATVYQKLAVLMPEEQKIDRFTVIAVLRPLLE